MQISGGDRSARAKAPTVRSPPRGIVGRLFFPSCPGRATLTPTSWAPARCPRQPLLASRVACGPRRLASMCVAPTHAQISPEEQQAIVSGLDDPAPLQANGIYANGKKFLTLQANPRSIYGKSGVRITHSPSGRRSVRGQDQPGGADWRLRIAAAPRRRQQGGRGSGRLLDIRRLLNDHSMCYEDECVSTSAT